MCYSCRRTRKKIRIPWGLNFFLLVNTIIHNIMLLLFHIDQKALMYKKGALCFFGSIFISCRIELFFGRLTCLDMERTFCDIVFDEPCFVFEK